MEPISIERVSYQISRAPGTLVAPEKLVFFGLSDDGVTIKEEMTDEKSSFSDFGEKCHSSSANFAIDSTYDDPKNLLITTYPWILDFRKQCLSELMNSNMRSLMKLIKLYSGNISKAVEDCYSKPKRAMKLKIEISNTLAFFHYAYKEIKTPLEHFSYLEKMSDLMAMYVDMEIKASRNGIESVMKVASMITSSLKLFFGKYSEYTIDSLLKTNLITKSCSELGDLIFRWVLRDDPGSPLDSVTYIRNILAYKMWKKIMLGSKSKQQRITRLACMRLKPPVGFKEKLESIQSLRDLFPILPNSNITHFLMKAKFSIRETAKRFYNAVASPIVLATLNQPCFPIIEDSDSILDEKASGKVDQLLNNIWNILNGGRSVNSSITKHLTMNSNELLKNSKFKRKRENVNNEIKSEPQEKPTENSSVVGEDKHSIKLEIENVFIRLTQESLYQYEHSIEDFFHAEEENKDMLYWKSDLDVKKENYIMKEDKSEDLDTSECCIKSDLEDEIIGSSNECLFDLKDLSVVEGEKGDDGEHSSSLPLKKRRGFPYSKYVKNDSTDTSDMVSGEHEERKMIFKTPAQLKAFSSSFNGSTDLINLALGSHDDHPYPVSNEADSISEKFPPPLIKRKATSTSSRGRRKRRGRPRKKKLTQKQEAEESNRLLDELTATAGFFK
ncbi:uncharacterized protein [Halyomorpha halys]|uniref:uncharacterized protein n=1 Tax=Halyomorpha halys TaxID=286706 RepID=UPI0006D51B33|nr:uncharacterized protein LOC106690787 [Halyomorpha halys]